MLTSRLRRLMAQLCMLLLAHATWLAAAEPCATADTHTNAAHAVAHGAVHDAAPHGTTPHGAHAQVHAPAASPTHHEHDIARAADPVNAVAPRVPSSPASPTPAACSMAMACAMSALQITLPEVPVRVVPCDDATPRVVATALHSVRTAPEPPPPRG